MVTLEKNRIRFNLAGDRTEPNYSMDFPWDSIASTKYVCMVSNQQKNDGTSENAHLPNSSTYMS